MESVIPDPSVVVATKDHFSCPLGDDTIILDVKAGLYFSLDNVGALVWQLVQDPTSVKELRAAILERYEVEPEVCERDLLALLRELAARDLIEIRDATSA
jgi:Coenzyme PQQ synthesis protein D (PqqD)